MKSQMTSVKTNWPLLLTALFLISLSSCLSDDAKDLLDVHLPLEGTTWTMTNESKTDCTESADNTSENCTSDCDVAVLENGTVTITSADEPEAFSASYTINGNVVAVSYEDDGQQVTENIQYAITLNQLVLTFEADDDGCITINTFTGTE